MPEYLAPGVYVEEVDTGTKPIEGVSTSTSGMVGLTERGPVNVPTLVTGVPEFRRDFGGLLDRRVFTGDTWYLPHAVGGFFTNGGKRLYVVRVLPDTATAAAVALFDRGVEGGASTRLAVNALRGATAVVLESLDDIEDEDWLRLYDESRTDYVRTDIPVPPDRGVRALRTPLKVNRPAGVATPVTVLSALAPLPGHALASAVPAGVTRLPLVTRGAIAVGEVLRLGTALTREFALVASLPLDAADQSVTLRHGLAFGHDPAIPAEVVIDRFADPGPVGPTHRLNQNASAGQAILILDDVVTSAIAGGELIRIGAQADADREYHVAAAVTAAGAAGFPFAHALRTPTLADHPVGEPLRVVTFPPRTTVTVVAASAITVADATGLEAGDSVRIGSNLRRIVGVSVSTLTIDSAVAATPGDPVFLALLLRERTEPGADTLPLTSRKGLAVGDVIRIGAGPTEEVRVVAWVPSDALDTRVRVNLPLRLAHDPAPPVSAPPDVVVELTRTAGAETRTVQAIRAGRSLIMVADDSATTALGPGVVVEIGAPPSATEHAAEYQTIDQQADLGLLGLQWPAGTVAGLVSDHTYGIGVDERAELLRVQAVDRGGWGNVLRIKVEDDEPILQTRAAQELNVASRDLRLDSTVGLEVGSVVEIAFGPTDSILRKVTGIVGRVATLDASHGRPIAEQSQVRTREFRITVECVKPGGAGETYRHLSMDPRHGRYVSTVIGRIFRSAATTPLRADGRTDGESRLIRVEDALADTGTGQLSLSAQATAETTIRLGPDLITETRPDRRRQTVGRFLSGGDDRITDVNDDTYRGQDDTDPRLRTGLFALKNIDEVAIVAIPGRTSQTVEQALLDHCDLMRYRFAVLDSAKAGTRSDITLAEVQEQRGLYDSKYGALYYPWLRIPDPFPENRHHPGLVSIPPSGHVMGIYARSDIERGVHKAPANETIRGIRDLELKLNKDEQDILNPRNINVLRNFRDSNRGLRVWGARTVTSNPDWKYVNVRRLFIFIEHSIDKGTQWVVFEPNSYPLWERVRRVVSAFLTTVWREGALMGRTPEEAFYVKCDRTTMDAADIDNGRLIVEVGIAPVKPAEFVIFRIGQWAGGSELTEA